MKRLAALLTAAVIGVLCLMTAAAAETGLEKFTVHHGDRESPKIAITMDDASEPEYVAKALELCREYGISMTFFPNGFRLREEDRELWLDVIEAGCEIGSHGNDHLKLSQKNEGQMLFNLGLFQEKLDRLLQVHYPVRWYRPAFGNIEGADGSTAAHMRTIKRFGYEHVIHWDVSQTDPAKAIKAVKNGSILLYHARKKDYECLKILIPQLLEAGFVPVTVSELFGMDNPVPGGELYEFNIADYRGN